MTTREHLTHLGGDAVEVSEEILEPRGYSKMRPDVQGNTGYVVWNSEREAHVLSLGHGGTEMVVLLVRAPDSQTERNARLVRENVRLAREFVQSQSEWEGARRRLESSRSITSSSQPSPESRLRMLMNDQTATVKQVTEAAYATEVVVAEMRREIAGKRL